MKNLSTVSTFRYYPGLIFGSLVLFLCAIELLISQHLTGKSDANLLAFAITLDLVLGIPLIAYIVLVRHKKTSILIIVPIFFSSLYITKTILPVEHQHFVNIFYQVIPFIELVVIVYGLFNLRNIISEYRRSRGKGQSAVEAMTAALTPVFPNHTVRSIIITEFFIAYFALGGGREVASRHDLALYSIHRRSGYGALLGVMLFCMGIESIVVHILVQMWNPTVAWVLTALSAFGVFWLWGDYSAIKHLPLIITPTSVHFRLGIRWNAHINRASIAEIRRISRKEIPILQQGYKKNLLKLTPMSESTILVILKHPVEFKGLYGKVTSAQALLLNVDDERAFIQALT